MLSVMAIETGPKSAAPSRLSGHCGRVNAVRFARVVS
jgi:hypothetical protein